MKQILLSTVVLFSLGVNAQQVLPEVKTTNAVGIETTEPRATLDVNGDTRIRTIEDCTDCEWALVTGSNGIVQKVPLSNIITESKNGNQEIGGADLGVGTTGAISDRSQYITSYKLGSQQEQGVIDNGVFKIRFTIPYQSGNGASYNEVVSKTMTTVESAADGVSVPIEMKILQGTLANGDGELVAEISTPEKYKVKLLNIGQEVKIADFKYSVGSATRAITLKAIGGIPDKNFNHPSGKFKYVYTTYVDKEGNTWLNTNLGAEYSRMGSDKFNPAISIVDKKDINAVGNEFVYTDTRSVLVNVYTPDGQSTQIKLSDDKDYNPCPYGFALPTSFQSLENRDRIPDVLPITEVRFRNWVPDFDEQWYAYKHYDYLGDYYDWDGWVYGYKRADWTNKREYAKPFKKQASAVNAYRGWLFAIRCIKE